MMRIGKRRLVGLVFGCLAALVLAAGALGMRAAGQSAAQPKAAISADQAVACVRTAVAAKPGDVRAVEAEREGGKLVCEVEVLAQDGKTYEVVVDTATGAVIEVESDDEDDDN
jgi:uncharacterized membrane protein YkoI